LGPGIPFRSWTVHTGSKLLSNTIKAKASLESDLRISTAINKQENVGYFSKNLKHKEYRFSEK